MENNKYFYITTPIYYVNDIPHIGHFYTTLACDVIARYKRLKNYDVIFTTGTDEHGIKIENKAHSLNISPKELTDNLSNSFEQLFKDAEFTNTKFIRTTNKLHKVLLIKIWNILYNNNYIYKGEYEGYYSVNDESFYSKSEIKTNNNGELVAISSNNLVTKLKEESYFFKLSVFQDRLIDYYDNNPNFIEPKEKFNEVKSFVKSGLKDLSISRIKVKWGIPVPNDEQHTIYVWLDALCSYLTGIGYSMNNSKLFNNFWPVNVHVIGKDILKFHAIYWPAILMALNISLPKKIFAHGWWTNNKQKISKSLGNTINPKDLIKSYGLDEIKYFLLKEIPFGNDGDFNQVSVKKRINSELVNEYGNLCQRSISIIYNSLNQKVKYKDLNLNNNSFILDINKFNNESEYLIDTLAFSIYLEKIWKIIKKLNLFINESAPWSLIKNKQILEANKCLYIIIHSIKDISLLLLPFIPNIAKTVLEQIGFNKEKYTFEHVGEFVEEYFIKNKPYPIINKVMF